MLIIMSASRLLSSITSLHGPELAAARNTAAVSAQCADLYCTVLYCTVLYLHSVLTLLTWS